MVSNDSDVSLSELRERFKRLHWSAFPECPTCGLPFVNPIDFHTGLPKIHLYRPMCFCFFDRRVILRLG